MKQNCPHCGNVVKGQVKASFARKMTRAAVKKGSAAATGAAIGSIIPGVGTIVGGTIGLVAGVLMEDDVKKVSDGVENTLFDNTNAEYEFNCPKCGYQWTSGASTNARVNTNSYVEYDYEEDDEDNDEESIEEATFSEFFNWCAKNTSDAIEGFEEVESTCNDKIADCSSDVVRSEYAFLLSWLRMERLIENMFFKNAPSVGLEFDLKEIKQGHSEIKRAINLLGAQDDEYVALKKIYELWLPPFGNKYDTGLAYIQTKPLKDYNPSGNLLTADYMKYIWAQNINNFIENNIIVYEDSLIGQNTDAKENELTERTWFVRIKKGVDYFSYAKNEPDNDHYLLWLTLAEKLAYRYYSGNGCDVDYKKALPLVNASVEAGRFPGMLLKASMLFLGDGIPQNSKKARELLTAIIDSTEDNTGNFYRRQAIDLLHKIDNDDQVDSEDQTKDNEAVSEENQSAEAEYIETLREVVEDGEISNRERRLLEKLRVKLGISEQRAAELETSLSQPSLSEEEQEYLAEYRDIVAEGGKISSRERKLLDKIARMNGITPDRIKELESMA